MRTAEPMRMEKEKSCLKKGRWAASAVTDEKGEASVKDLPLGIYEIRERKLPETFQEPKEETVAELLWKDQETPVIRWEKDWKNLRQKIEIRVQKKDSEDGTPIEGAVFPFTRRRIFWVRTACFF